jgi:hypothetical protein
MERGKGGDMLTLFKDYRPTQFDAAGMGAEGQEDWLVLPVIRTRDSGPREESNFHAALKDATDNSVEHDTHRFGHWGPGWFEIIVIAPAHRAWGESLAKALADYPVLDEADLGEREHEDACAGWESWGSSDFMRAVAALLPEGQDADDLTAPDLSEAQECGVDVEHGGDGPHFCHMEEAAKAWLESKAVAS